MWRTGCGFTAEPRDTPTGARCQGRKWWSWTPRAGQLTSRSRCRRPAAPSSRGPRCRTRRPPSRISSAATAGEAQMSRVDTGRGLIDRTPKRCTDWGGKVPSRSSWSLARGGNANGGGAICSSPLLRRRRPWRRPAAAPAPARSHPAAPCPAPAAQTAGHDSTNGELGLGAALRLLTSWPCPAQPQLPKVMGTTDADELKKLRSLLRGTGSVEQQSAAF
jgi:hypothetical protein